jgi:hypothetical protein
VTGYRTIGIQGFAGIPLPPESLQVCPSCRTEKVLRGAIIQGVLCVFSKDESFFIYDLKASTVTFCNITFTYGHIITAVGTINNFTLAGEQRVTPQIIMYDLGSNINYSTQNPPSQNHIKIFFITTYLLIAST